MADLEERFEAAVERARRAELEVQTQRERARASSKFSAAGGDGLKTDAATDFLGYDGTEAESEIVALFKDGELVHMVERHHIEGRSAEMIANHLEQVYAEFC